LRVITAQAMRAILFASATVTSLMGRCSRIFLNQVPTAPFHPSARWTIDLAHSTSSLRISRLPVLVIRPRRVFPPVEFCAGTRPSQAGSVPHDPLHLLIDSTGLQVYGAGQWLEAKHGAKSRRKWRTLPLAVDAGSDMIVAQTLTDQDADDPSQVALLLNQIECRIARVTADGVYDGAPTYDTIAAHGDDVEILIPPRSTAVLSGEQGLLEQRNRHLEMITAKGRLAWQKATDYGQRSFVETTMGRYKALIGPRLRARGFAARQTEAAVGVAVLNRMLAASRPDSVRCLHAIA
jgi:hypothetical protein